MIAPVKPPEGWISGTAEGVACLAKMKKWQHFRKIIRCKDDKNMYTPERSFSGGSFTYLTSSINLHFLYYYNQIQD